jgi:hypothetical protein
VSSLVELRLVVTSASGSEDREFKSHCQDFDSHDSV